MTSGFTTTPLSPVPAPASPTVEYRLSAADYHALDMFLYDTVVSRKLGFHVRVCLFYTLLIVVGAVVARVLDWLVAIQAPAPSPLPSFQLVGVLALICLAICVCGLVPGGYLHRILRRENERRFRRHRKLQLRAGIINFDRWHQVVLTSEGFTETTTLHETSASVQITKQEMTTVSWSAVSAIVVTDDHAFFTIAAATQSFSSPGFLILPRSAFPSEANFHAFAETARRKREAALGLLAAAPRIQASDAMGITRSGRHSH